MSRTLVPSLLTSLALSALAAPALAVDVAFDVSRLFLRYTTPAPSFSDSGAVLLPSTNSASRPFNLPCEMDRFGVQIDARYVSGTVTVYPQLQARYYTVPNTLVWSNGYEFASPAPFSVVRSNVSPLAVGQTAIIGQMSIDATNPASRNWLFQPSDLPPNVVVRHALHVSLYSAEDYQTEVVDEAPANNNRFVYIRRVCP
jgi:hypothetical protein